MEFVDQSDLAGFEAYEQFIFQNRKCPVREGWHDFFNGLCWLQFPRTKSRLNQLQAAEIEMHGVGPARGPLRDALTLMDENAALLQAPDPLWSALAARDWGRLFIELRPLWRQARLTLFGHALLEKLVTPRKAITAHVYWVDSAIATVESLDAWLAGDMSGEKLASKPFLPLPVLGIPGWCVANSDPAFYDDEAVFRRKSETRRIHVPKSGAA